MMKRTVAAALVTFVTLICSLAHGQSNAIAPSIQGSNLSVTATSSPPTPVISASAPIAQGDIVEFACRQIDLETQRLDKLVQNAETVGKLLATLVVGFAAILSFFGYRSIKEFKEETQASVQSMVDRTLADRSKSGETFEQLVASLAPAQSRWKSIEGSLDNLAKFEALSTARYGDAQGAYAMVNALSEKEDASPDERRAALGYLLKIIELGEQGRVDPNLLFNACSKASTMDFDHEALKLATLCAHWDPKPSHILRRSRLEDTFGMRFEMKNHALVLSDLSPQAVRAEAWTLAKDLVSKGQRFQCELIFSEFQNIATRNRESGYIDEAIPVLEELTKDGAGPSYVFAVLSNFYAMRGNAAWLSDYLSAARAAARLISEESPASTWYEHTIRDLLKMAKRTRSIPEITEILKQTERNTDNQASEATSEPAPGADSSAPRG